jgi:hypothetical protein
MQPIGCCCPAGQAVTSKVIRFWPAAHDGPRALPRRIPIEIHVVGDKVPVYEDSLEDLGRFNEQPVLPFNAYGTLAVARAEFDNNSGSSQVRAVLLGG